ncbi:hypothetical protein Lser_V15G32707 [Lactuca serriola]
MEARGPSPLVPFLMLNVLAMIIFSPMVENLVVIPILLMFVIYLLSSFFSYHASSLRSYQYGDHGVGSHENEGLGAFGAFLMVAICVVLCRVIS